MCRSLIGCQRVEGATVTEAERLLRQHFSRRAFLKRAGAGVLGLSFPALLPACDDRSRTASPARTPTPTPTASPTPTPPPLTVDPSRPWWLQSDFAPVFDERTDVDLLVRGAIPPELNGLYVRNSSNPQHADSPHWFFGGYLHFFGYWFVPPYLTYHVADADGRVINSQEITVAGSTMMHSFAITERDAVFWELPVVFDLESAVMGEIPFKWQPDYGARIGVMPLGGMAADMRWVEIDPCYVFHPMNAHEDDDRIVGDVMQYDAAPLFPDPDGRPGDPTKAVAYLTRWTFDLNANTNGFKREQIDDLAGEFPRFDERSAGLSYRHGFFAASSDSRFVDQFDTLAHMDLKTNKRSAYQLPKGDVVSEPIFIPRKTDAREGDGYLLATIYRGAERRSDLAVFDTVSLETGPIALAELSHRVPFGFHGNWRPDVGN